ncbi:DUF4148 domain-containing protein [Robbsia sp. Bb-Pol-6]|uniref:DUF4148 domain-containing protein n=1 Tax=Robbsia betulipollinis TaxID=2981849 RepID=A0ABT3ZS62_9BURK|nr:DUF4148 domain-containing protein [Robbsia betulipollinis]MCY0389055.1 DUF4148 domain-containing protein [Robbsia betulipollinis]
MKKITIATLLFSTVIAVPAFAQDSQTLNAGGNIQKTRAEVRAELADAVRAGYAPQSANRRDTAFVYGTTVRAHAVSRSVSSIPVANDTAD